MRIVLAVFLHCEGEVGVQLFRLSGMLFRICRPDNLSKAGFHAAPSKLSLFRLYLARPEWW